MIRSFTVAVLLCVMLNAAGQSFVSSNLPIIIIDTYGQNIPDDPRITVHFGIIDNGPGNTNYVTDPFNSYDGEVTIEIRGSTSQQYPKKSYAFSPVDPNGYVVNAPILGMPAENDWVLYAPYSDKTLMRNTLAYSLANRMGHYASRTQFVEMVINGNYRGVYELHERVKRDDNRVDIDQLTPADTSGDELTGGYIIKIDKTTASGTQYWNSAYDNLVFFQYHDPEDIELLPVQKNYIQDYVEQFETVLLSSYFTDPDSGFRKYADESSLIDFFILEELGHTVDGYRSSCFIYKDKDSNGGKLTLGPVWDFNVSFGNIDYCNGYNTDGWQYQFNSICNGFDPHVPFWWTRFLQDPLFADHLRCRWNELRQGFLHTDSITHWVDSVAAMLDDAQERNFDQWPILGTYVAWNFYIGQTYDDEVDWMKSWIAQRCAWLDNNITGNCTITSVAVADESGFLLDVYPNPLHTSAIISVSNTSPPLQFTIFDLYGRIVKGIHLQETSTILYRDELPDGIYMYQLSSGEKLLRSGKLVME